METSLHRQLKEAYADDDAEMEVRLQSYRIDVVSKDRLIEIQHGSLAAIRDKVELLLGDHKVLLVKPIVVRKQLVKLDEKGGQVLHRRTSPKRGNVLQLFDELVYFTRVFPHPNLTLEVPLVEIEEWRYPGHGRRRRHRENDYQIEDQRLLSIQSVYRFRESRDIARLIPPGLPSPFHTGQLAEHLDIDRWAAQKVAYCLRESEAVRQVGKDRNTLLYEFARHSERTQAA